MSNCNCNIKIRDLLRQNTELQDRNTELVLKNRELEKNSFSKYVIDYNIYNELISLMTIYLYNIQHDFNFNMIVAPPRGALPIATHVSHHLNINNIIFDINHLGKYSFKQNKILILDDIIDTGKTMKNITKQLPTSKIFVASLYYKPHSKFKPDYYVKETSDWIVFPWERKDEKPNREMYKDLSY